VLIVDSINWSKVRKKKLQDRQMLQRSIQMNQAKYIPEGTNVRCPNGNMGRVVKHQNGLNVVINSGGNVLGSFATSDLRPW
jgi:hypothetical protein